ncbi:lipopolysaccharide biosynthesis protein [Kineococcus rhizosphaerae]|uniref:O-antigen/teichoic acid export membrane protein n=1 Tax=Kineococcus rhizosphaerae TaxID=559628 RepID=A0A2T0R5G3_9ACTN|nr:hypothetical protein [Kineococcus rhizosphaerae]PRY15984.1 O-antigen/teichoic acid export membrane protein [Kineococcus rhizosphaerae]
MTPGATSTPSTAGPPRDRSIPPGLQRILRISASLVTTQAATSVLGLLFWAIASRGFTREEFGVANAAVSAMGLLGALGTLGLGTLLISLLPGTEQGVRRVTVRTALAVSGVAGTLLAVVVPFVAVHLLGLGNLSPIAGSPGHAALFAVGTGLAALALVLDQAVLVIGSGNLQLERNVTASATKVVVLLGLAAAGATDGMAVFAAWAVGTLVSLPVVAHRTRGGRPLQRHRRLVDLSSMRGLGRRALSHHALNTTLQSPLMLLPVIVTATVSAAANAPFGAALQLTGFVFALPYALSVGLFAAAEGDDGEVLRRMRVTLPLGLGVSLAANLALWPLAPYVLRVFGASYAEDGADVLRILVLAGLPFVVKDHFVALRRVQGRTGSATLVLVVCTAAELVAALIGAHLGGVEGLSAAWVLVLVLEAVLLAVPLVRARRRFVTRTREQELAGPDGGGREHRPEGAGARADEDGARDGTRSGDGDRSGDGGQVRTSGGDDVVDVLEQEPAVASVVDPAPSRRGSRGLGPALLAIALGLLAMALAAGRARTTGDDGGLTQLLWEAGLVLIVAPAALLATWPRTSGTVRVWTAVTAAVALQLSRVVLYPTRFMFHDELLHANLLRQISDTGQLFGVNPLLPITAYYPGLEVATDGVGDLTGLSQHTSAVLLLLAARVVLSLAIVAVVTRLTRSHRAGAVAVVVYACNPQMLFFNSQFSYQTLALPLAVLTVALFASRRRGSLRGLLLPLAALGAVVITHHVTAVLLLVALAVWTVVDALLARVRRRAAGGSEQVGGVVAVPPGSDARALAVMTLVGAVCFAATLLNPGNTLGSYLGSIVTSSSSDLGAFFEGRQTKALFANTAGVGPAWWEQGLLLGGLVITAAALVPSLWAARAWVRVRVPLAVVLVLTAVLWPLVPGGHVARATSEVGDRAAGFVFLGVGFVVAWWLVRRAASRRAAGLFGAAATVAFLGGVVLGSGTVSAQLPGPFLVSADARSVDADNIAAADWMGRTLPPETRVYADRVSGLLVAADGGMFTVRHISTGIDASRLILDPEFGQDDVDLIRRAGIRYLVVDRRDANGLPNQGVYIESGEFGGQDRTAPVPAAALQKFDDVPGVDRVYDNGAIAVYDLSELSR